MGWRLGGCLVARMIVERVGASERLYSVLSCNVSPRTGSLCSACCYFFFSPSETASVGYDEV